MCSRDLSSKLSGVYSTGPWESTFREFHRKVCFLHIFTHSKSPNTCTVWFFYLIELFGREKVVIGSEYAARGDLELRPDYVQITSGQRTPKKF